MRSIVKNFKSCKICSESITYPIPIYDIIVCEELTVLTTIPQTANTLFLSSLKFVWKIN